MNDMASIRKMRPLPWAATRCLLGGEVPGEPVAATSSFDVDCFFRYNVERLENYDQRKPNARMQHVNQKIFPIDIVDVAIVGIGPTHRPGFDKLEPIAAVLKP